MAIVIERVEVRALSVPLVDPFVIANGRVDVTRSGNTFEAKTHGVARFTLLLSLDAVDLHQPATQQLGEPTLGVRQHRYAHSIRRELARERDHVGDRFAKQILRRLLPP